MKLKNEMVRLLVFLITFVVMINIATAKAILQSNQSTHKTPSCSQIAAANQVNILEADVVAIDHPIVFNRLGAQNVNWMIYALRHDVVDFSNSGQEKILDYTDEGNALFEKVKNKHTSRDVALRRDLRPRPLVLRVAAGDYLRVRFTNLLHHKPKHYGDAPANFANPFDYPDPLGINHPQEHNPENQLVDPETKKSLTISQKRKIYTSDDQVASRVVGFHPQGLELVASIDDDSSYVGKNKLTDKEKFLSLNQVLYEEYEDRKFESASLAQPGETLEYCFYAEKEGAYLVSSNGAVLGGEGTAGNSGVGLFGAIIVEPKGARFYRAQVTEEEMRLATSGYIKKVDGVIKAIEEPEDENGNHLHPKINYEAIYHNDCASIPEENGIWCQEGKAGKPILNMVWGNRIWHGDINAIIVGPNSDGGFPEDTYPLESIGSRNPTLPNRLEPFREFVSIFHDENAATQAFPYFFEHPELGHTLHGVRDSFMINYGSGGVGAEIIANRIKAGPMQDCVDCAYEEFFLSSFVVGDAAMLVDRPANLITSQCQPEFLPQLIDDPEDPTKKRKVRHWKDVETKISYEKFCEPKEREAATKAYYPHDPANVHHSYIGDFVKFRNLHSGKEQHIFHLHNHQWLFNPNDDNSNYIDAQGIGPGSGYTYEIAFGGSGNRNKTVGDAIFHCHFYPHFAQGMWYMWRNHDVFEAGTPLVVSQTDSGYHKKPFELASGESAANARALPDGEIVAGTPIPAIVPLPGKGMAPMPEKVHVVEKENKLGSKAVLAKPFSTKTKNPGYPFWIAGVTEHGQYYSSVGSRPTTPPLDMCNENNCKDIFKDEQIKAKVRGAEGHDGGLPRHALAGYSAGGDDESELTRLSAKRDIKKAKPIYYHEEGTDLEKVAMEFHAQREHDTYKIDMEGTLHTAVFTVNGAPKVPGAPFNDPCIDDQGKVLVSNRGKARFYGKDGYVRNFGKIEFGGDNPRIYKGANIQLDVVFNKLGYHYPQQRILALWEDVGDLLGDKTGNKKAPEPLVMRLNTFDCAMYAHTNLVPKEFYADDYQITTPTDVIGQHIHLPKWDLTSADGGANGWNYEDGTLSPGAVRERITAINGWNDANPGKEVKTLDGRLTLIPEIHPYFNAKYVADHQVADCKERWNEVMGDSHEFEIHHGMPGKCNWLGARTSLQRWFSDPIVNRYGKHRGLGTTFTHDHLGPSTHQQLGLYATMLSEPPGSEWRHNETGEKLYDVAKREDGGPTSWQAVITGKGGKCIDVDHDSNNGDCTQKGDDSHREFFLQFGDFQHAYVKGAFYGVNEKGIGWRFDPEEKAKPTPDSFRFAINPSVRKPAKPVFPDILAFESTCPGGKEEAKLPGASYNAEQRPLRPCPEAISADDVGMMVVNYRNEPLGARVYDPERRGPDGKKGMQATGKRGDLAFAMQTRDDRAISVLNTKYGNTNYYPLTAGILPGDSFTPMIRAYSGDRIKIKIQGGSHEHEHNASINALSWLQGGSGYGEAPHSGWRNSQNAGLSEQFTFQASVVDYESPTGMNDRMYTIDTSQDGLWNGVWGVIRTHNVTPPDKWKLETLPTNELPTILAPGTFKSNTSPSLDNLKERLDNVCPSDAPVFNYRVSAVLANRVLSKSLGIEIPSWRSRSYQWWEWAWWQSSTRSQLNSNGGSLIYNPRATEISLEIVDEVGKVVEIQKYGSGPLHDPTAILFVRDEDLDSNGYLKSSAPLEPLVLRAPAGACIQVTLTNRLPANPEHMPDLDGYTSVSGIIPRNCPDLGKKSEEKNAKGDCYQTQVYNSSMTSFNNNLVRPSNHIALHAQMVNYDVQASDGNNVGINAESTVAPGKHRRYSWYTGKIELPQNACEADDDEARKYLISFTYPYISSLSSQFLNFDDPDHFINTILTQMNYRIVDGYDPYYPALPDFLKGKTTGLEQYTENSIMNLYKAWRKAGTNEYDESFGATSFNWMKAWLVRGMMNFEDHCVDKVWNHLALDPDFWKKEVKDEKRKRAHSDSILFDRVKILHAMNVLASCRGEPKTIVNYQHKKNVRLIHIGKVGETLPQDCKPEQMARFVPIEYGGSNLTPPDRIKQGQKGAIGALIIEPEGAQFPDYDETSKVVDRQQDPESAKINLRYTRSMADVVYPTDKGERKFRDLVLVHQKGLNLRYKDGSAVPNIAAEKEEASENSNQTAPEDAHDSGHMAINYGSEPMWFRFGLPPDAPFGKSGFGGIDSAWQAFSNDCCTNGKEMVTAHIEDDEVFRVGSRIGTVISANQPVGEPAIPIMKAYAGQEMRIRALMPTGTGRGSVVELHGHHWMRDPYLAEFVEPEGYPKGGNQFGFYDKKGKFHEGWGTPSKCIGENALAMHLGGQESVTPMAHFDLVFPRAGGKRGVKGDYLWRDYAGFGITNGLWALIRVEDAPQEYTNLYKGDFAPESLRTSCNFVVASNNQAVLP